MRKITQPLHTKKSCNLAMHKITQPLFLSCNLHHKKKKNYLFTIKTRNLCTKKSSNLSTKKSCNLRKEKHKNHATSPPTKITQTLNIKNHATSLPTKNYITSPQKNHANSPQKNLPKFCDLTFVTKLL